MKKKNTFYNKIRLQNVFYNCIMFLFFSAVFSSCEKSVIFNVATQEGKLVVNSFIGTYHNATASVSLSVDPLSNTYPPYLSDATIQLYKNDIYITDYIYSSYYNNYFADSSFIHAEAGDAFKIIVNAPGKESVTASTIIPSKIEIEDIRIVDTVMFQSYEPIYDSLGYPIYSDSILYYKIEIDFTDPEGDDKYSLVTKYSDDLGGINTCFTTDDPAYTLGDAFQFSSSENNYYTICDVGYFDDLTFNGTKKTLTIYLIQISGSFFPGAKYEFVLQHLSDEYYKYASSVNLQSVNFENPFAEIVPIYSNINGGFGIFASYNESIAEIDL